ncbi:hypothetical protein L9F63_005465, partial [Diploptera punctata]
MATVQQQTTQLEFHQAMADFKTMFPDMDDEVIEAVLRANQGAVDATIDQLLAMTTDNENEKLRNEMEQKETLAVISPEGTNTETKSQEASPVNAKEGHLNETVLKKTNSVPIVTAYAVVKSVEVEFPIRRTSKEIPRPSTSHDPDFNPEIPAQSHRMSQEFKYLAIYK